MQTDRKVDMHQTGRPAGREEGRQARRQTERQAGTKAERQADRKEGRKVGRLAALVEGSQACGYLAEELVVLLNTEPRYNYHKNISS
ncbi:hypothetical protein DPMN_106473 [Dreissena polymorpha]|uniref:Uncharacterized protein n=1 Tax=Dreissena polymorpha TaxID=45954 RepID=A0A9D4K590_DREPO|nr:hypothetical protein DPMN_106473 [Dreissena polymorpha]